ncbi:lycopene beta-cyclase CrtY [Billgrantia antri]|uniref:Lycopene beta-cyclase CrtY n=1 Tax=Billgrantia antri TaxID=2846777 RepID=A0ABS6ZJ22_9GAMM|nr:lycopene beta-cyclase CrtY [Halomonas antri]MBW6390052.1 lycopene beta-cyclase CrtY [Halomonas antri]
MTARHDLILVGGGLANGLIALRLKQVRPELDVLLLEQDAAPGGNHTWSFHDSDLTPAQWEWIGLLVGCRWAHHEVRFPQRRRTLHSGYASIFSQDFARVLRETLGNALRVEVRASQLGPTQVRLEDGHTLHASAVIDGRGVATSPHLALGYQAFLGQELRLTQPHGLSGPILMDATVAQGQGYRFVYVLPFTRDTLLIEDTHYVDSNQVDTSQVDRGRGDKGRLDPQHLRDNIADYAYASGWQVQAMLREESGVLPITLAGDVEAFWRDAHSQPRSGLRAGLFHPTTGYSLPHAVRLADRIARLDDLSAPALFDAIRREALGEWRRQGYFRLLNRMLFLAGRPEQRWRVMQRFYGLPEPLIQRFYAERLTALDKLRIVSGKPPVPMGEALRAARLGSPHQIRTAK